MDVTDCKNYCDMTGRKFETNVYWHFKYETQTTLFKDPVRTAL
jgi:hypothetical protein